ncbi:alpha/beta hydrolase [Zhihengliuella halotolerans]|uniref:alpha/beta hydrolase n=1 Tax=Zhihengliuella halotolerans TaxID=370736 RepID=UPI000C80A8FE|nr:alpha/beta hydrolase [Zhihengliuella halotolerans]
MTDTAARVLRNIPFARRADDLLLDLYLPPRPGPVPVVLWLHGGGWFTGDRTLAPDLSARAAATGFAYASVEYRLSAEAVFPAQLHDVRAAVRFLRARAADYGLDPDLVGAWGASAGGHLAALAGLTGHATALPGEDDGGAAPSAVVPCGAASSAVQAVAEAYGPADLAATVRDAVAAAQARGDTHADGRGTPEARLIGALPEEAPRLAAAASPLAHVHTGAPPFQIAHGTADPLVGHDQSVALHRALAAAGVESELYLLHGYKHGFLNPGGRLDVDLAAVMDDGRLDAEVGAVAERFGGGPAHGPTPARFGFETVDAFFHRHLGRGGTASGSPHRGAA